MAKSKTPSFEKEKIGRVRLGIKLKSIFWPIDRNGISEVLAKLNYKDMRISPEGSFSAGKHNVEFYSGYSKLIFGFYADTVNTAIESQKEFFSVVQREYKTDLSKYVQFYEIEFISTVITDNNVYELYSNLFDDAELKKKFEYIVGENLQINKLEFTKKGQNVQDDNWFSIELSPKVESGGNAYFCRIVKRNRESQPAYDSLRKASEIVDKLINEIEK